MNGNASNNVTKIARIFGTKISVCSWIWVSAWNSDTTTPTTSPITIKGDDTTTMVQIASRATSRVSAPVISRLPYFSLRSPTVIARSVSDEAIQSFLRGDGLLRFARNDETDGVPKDVRSASS